MNIDLLKILDDHDAKTESFYNTVCNNDNIINKNNITLSVNDDHSMINDKVSQNYISLKSIKHEEISYNDIMSVSLELYNALKRNKKYQTIIFVFYYNL